MVPIVALLTDFGLSDSYVGVMKGVMLGICPDARLIDITHAIAPQNVRQGALMVLNSARYFPAGTVFLAVVDPGVGSARRPIVAQAGDYRFVAPDNGLLSYILRELGDYQAHEAANPAYQLPQMSSTFHGRDIFAPAAAHLATGSPLESFGPTVTDPVMLPYPELSFEDNRLTGEIIHIDHFGNLITSIGLLEWESLDTLALTPRFASETALRLAAGAATAVLGGQRISGIKRSYADAWADDLLALVGSGGSLEISVNGGSAAARLGVGIGAQITLELG